MLIIIKMSEILTLSLISSIVYLIFRFIETKHISKEDVPIKLLMKDSLFVFVGVYLADFLVSQISEDVTGSLKTGGSIKTPAFIGDPEF
tara:strand:- start:4265 stop:4531 length:267 start_codon:yes stop_codon:yes gene_type:complete